MANEPSEFQIVTFQKEIDQLKNDLQTKVTEITAFAGGNRQFQCKVKQVAGDALAAEILSGRGAPLKGGDDIHIIFSSADGLYSMKATVVVAAAASASFKLGKDIYRLQRRHNFRTAVPRGYKIAFAVSSLRGARLEKGPALALLDVSAGGMRLVWPKSLKNPPSMGDKLGGVLQLPDNKQIEVMAVVRVVFDDPEAWNLGTEFEGLTGPDEQSILFTCMQIRRHQIALYR